MSIDTIGDFLTVLRNGILVGKRTVTVPCSRLKMGVANVLKEEGYIKDFEKTEKDNKNYLTVFLKYVDGECVIHELTRVSTPGRRCYERVNGLTSVVGGLGVSVLTTSAGVITDRQAKKLGIGGEVICHVW